MKQTRKNGKICDIALGYSDQGEEGIYALQGHLNIRPPYQREFIYNEKKQQAVIGSILKDYPLGIFYFNQTGEKEGEVLDGQQRLLSIMHYIEGDFAINYQGKTYVYQALPLILKQQINEYPLDISITQEGTEIDILEWFSTINVSSVPLNDQELRNAAYTGAWLSDAKHYFSRKNGGAINLASKYVKGAPDRQEILQTALSWIVLQKGYNSIEEYMSKHRRDKDAHELINNFQQVVDGAQDIFEEITPLSKYLRNQNGGYLYFNYHKDYGDPEKLAEQAKVLLKDDEVTNKSGIIEFLFSGNKKHLSLRAFSDSEKETKYHQQNGLCASCGDSFALEEMQGDHIIAGSKGGKTVLSNLQMLCGPCNKKGGNK